MKKYLSVIGLAARPAIIIMLAIFIISGAVQIFMFGRALPNSVSEYANQLRIQEEIGSSPFSKPHPDSLSTVMDNSFTKPVFTASFFIICVFLFSLQSIGPGKPQYTLLRLGITPFGVFILWSCFFSLCFMLLVFSETIVCCILGRMYLSALSEYGVTLQSLMVMAYRNDLLHSLMPLRESVIYIRNLFMCVGLGISAAYFTYNLRTLSRVAFLPIFYAVFSVLSFPRGMGAFGWCIFYCLLTATLTAYMIYSMKGGAENAQAS